MQCVIHCLGSSFGVVMIRHGFKASLGLSLGVMAFVLEAGASPGLRGSMIEIGAPGRGTAPSVAAVSLSIEVRSSDATLSEQWCSWLPQMVESARPQARIQDCGAGSSGGTADYHMVITPGGGSSGVRLTDLRVVNPRRQGGLPIDELHWKLSPESEATDLARRIGVQRAVNNFFSLETREKALKEIFLARGVGESNRIRLSDQGWYADAETGRQLTFDEAFERFLNESEQNKKWIKATIQVAGVLGAGAIWYYWDKEFNAQDWEYTLDAKGMRRKLKEGIRFDTNPMVTNSPLHPLAGSFYYAFTRGNGSSSMQALMMSFVGSALWELIVEYREVFSINDMIFTPVAGAAIGEAMHQLRLLFERSSGSIGHRILLTVFGGASAMDHWMSRSQAPQARSLDQHGLPSDVFHSAGLYLGYGGAQKGLSGVNQLKSADSLQVQVGAEITSIPGYSKAGQSDRMIWDTTQTELQISLGLSPQQIDSLYFFAKAAWAGYHRQSISTLAGDRLSGYSFLIGPSTAYSHSVRTLSDGRIDQVGIVNVLGTSMDLMVFLGGAVVRFKMDVHGDFAAVHSLAMKDYERAGGSLDGIKKIVAQQHYYYAFGMTFRNQLTLDFDYLELGAEYVRSGFSSIQGLDRYQGQVTDDFPMEDLSSLARAWLAVKLPVERLKLLLSWSRYSRTSQLNSSRSGAFSSSHTEDLGMLGVEYSY